MLGNLFMAACLLTLNIILIAIAGGLRLLPTIFRFLRRTVRGMLLLSVRFYDNIFKRLAPLLKRHLGIDNLSGWWYIPCSILLSLVIGSSIVLLLGIKVNGWSVGVCALHGLLVGLTRNHTTSPQGLHLGVDIE